MSTYCTKVMIITAHLCASTVIFALLKRPFYVQKPAVTCPEDSHGDDWKRATTCLHDAKDEEDSLKKSTWSPRS